MKIIAAAVAASLPILLASCPDPDPGNPNIGFDCASRPALSGIVKSESAIEGKYIVVLKPADKNVKSIMMQPTAQVKARVLQNRFKSITVGDVYDTGKFQAFSAHITKANLPAIAAADEVAYVQEDGVKKVSQVRSWGLDRIDQRTKDLDGAYLPGATGKDIVIGVVDTGVSKHPELGDRLLEGFSAHPGGTTDAHGHGTHVSVTVAGLTLGVAREAKIIPIRVLGADGSGSDSDVIRGISFLTQYKLSNPDIQVGGNMSLGGSKSSALDEAVCDSLEAGVQFAIAAGNEDQNANNSSPARVRQAITVGATGKDDVRAYFSNFGTLLDVFAPGVDIVSGTPSGGTTEMSGTSMASPHVAGLIALYLERHPGSTPQQVRDGLVGLATPGVVTDPKGSVNLLGYAKE